MNIPHYVSSLKLGTNSKMDLILVSQGNIPAAEVRFYPDNSRHKKVAHNLRVSGLHVIVVQPNPRAKHVSILCVGNSKLHATLLATLVTARENRQPGRNDLDQVWHSSYGVLMGYPMSAIEAYVRKSNLRHDELPEAFDGHPLYRFMPSRNNWRNELGTIEEWKAVIETLAPHLLRQLQVGSVN